MSTAPATDAVGAVDVDRVRQAVHTVADPEFPDIAIDDLGLVETIDVVDGDGGRVVVVGLVPTFSGCPALTMIADDVERAVAEVPGVVRCDVRWLSSPVWSTERMTPAARGRLQHDYTVTLRRKDGTLRCPACGSSAVVDQSMAGPTRCRSVAWCGECRNVVEVMR